MLKQRLITAALLIPLVVIGILYIPTTYLAIIFAMLVIQGAWEWSGLMRLSSTGFRLIYAIVVGSCLVGAWAVINHETTDWLALPVISIFWWLVAIILVRSYPQFSSRWSPIGVKFTIGLLLLVPTWAAIIGLHGYHKSGPYLVLYMLSLIWVADSGAYFGGKKWGKSKLAPEVSPGKTWEGVFCALIASAIYAGIAAKLFSLPGNQWVTFIVLSLVAVAFSIVGDLTESMFKRHVKVKDSGSLLPGHGGILDRIDSITAAAPVFVVGLWLGDFSIGGGMLGSGSI